MFVAGSLAFGSAAAIADDKSVVDDPSTQVWEHIPIEENVVEIGRYTLVLEEQTGFSGGMGYGSVDIFAQTLDTPSHQVIDDISVAFKGGYFRLDHFLGETREFSVKPTDCYVQMNIIDTDVMRSYADAERFIRIVYDRNNDGKLTEREMQKGSEKLRAYLLDFALEHVPSDGKRHKRTVITDLDAFAADFGAYRAPKEGRKRKVGHVDKLRTVVEYVVNNTENDSYSRELVLDEGSDAELILRVSSLYSQQGQVTALSSFTIHSDDAHSYYVDGVLRVGNLDGNLDEVLSFEAGHHHDRLITDVQQREFEKLVDRAYQIIVR